MMVKRALKVYGVVAAGVFLWDIVQLFGYGSPDSPRKRKYSSKPTPKTEPSRPSRWPAVVGVLLRSVVWPVKFKAVEYVVVSVPLAAVSGLFRVEDPDEGPEQV